MMFKSKSKGEKVELIENFRMTIVRGNEEWVLTGEEIKKRLDKLRKEGKIK